MAPEGLVLGVSFLPLQYILELQLPWNEPCVKMSTVAPVMQFHVHPSRSGPFTCLVPVCSAVPSACDPRAAKRGVGATPGNPLNLNMHHR